MLSLLSPISVERMSAVVPEAITLRALMTSLELLPLASARIP